MSTTGNLVLLQVSNAQHGLTHLYVAYQKHLLHKNQKYLVLALEKPAPICAMILDPQIKLRHLKKNQFFLSKHNISSLTVEEALQKFKFEVCSFDCSPSKMNPSIISLKKVKKKSVMLSSIEANIFGESTISTNLSAEIDQYITEVNEKPTTNIFTYWSQHKKVYPLLLLMAKSYLGIPATSAPSKRVFSQSKTIIGSQQHSLSSTSIQNLVCMKDWYQKFNKIVDISSVTIPDSVTHSNDKSDVEARW
ncbi:uncharacterized protein VP01_473g7 [Puccinia sorghi]|uniref:HAT C-terminal dimerisation domain-containing protein n=1 Tax=Puccinia sorghi TaxID=27349 RepID=A0A0L6UPW4_9BASI|nr:uncharacterized protein VP01_473g7 [Puccinia sorghi]